MGPFEKLEELRRADFVALVNRGEAFGSGIAAVPVEDDSDVLRKPVAL